MHVIGSPVERFYPASDKISIGLAEFKALLHKCIDMRAFSGAVSY